MTSAYDLVTACLTERTGRTGRNGTWRCPAHDDHTPSLSVSRGNEGVVIYCHAGCSTDDVVAALGLTMSDLFDESGSGAGTARAIVATYDYHDENGTLLFQTVRYTPKDFRQRRPDGHDGWLWNLAGIRRVLYRLPEVITDVKAGEQIWVAEGEKDAEALVRAGAAATCNPMGADSGRGNKWTADITATLAGADVVVVADDDDQGHRHARYVASQLEAAGCTVHTVKAAEGKDAATHLAAGHALQDFLVVDDDDTPTDDERPVSSSSARKPSRYFKEKIGLLAGRLADDIEAEGPLAYGIDDIMWSYNGGVWRPDRHVVANRATRLLGDRYRRSHGTNAEDIIRARSPRITCDPVSEAINFRNGLYLWRADQLRDHDPAVLSTVQLAVDWTPDATCPTFDEFLNQVVPEDMVPLVWEAIGYLLYSGNELHRAYMLMGSGRNGKGTLLRTLGALIGPANFTGASDISGE